MKPEHNQQHQLEGLAGHESGSHITVKGSP